MKKTCHNVLLFVLSLFILLSSCTPKNDHIDTKNQLTHHVFVWLKNPGSEQDRNKLIEGLKTLEKIEVINAAHIGVPASTEERPVVDHSYDASLLLFFDDTEAQKEYQDHPIHLAFVEKYSELWDKVVVYDTKPY